MARKAYSITFSEMISRRCQRTNLSGLIEASKTSTLDGNGGLGSGGDRSDNGDMESDNHR